MYSNATSPRDREAPHISNSQCTRAIRGSRLFVAHSSNQSACSSGSEAAVVSRAPASGEPAIKAGGLKALPAGAPTAQWGATGVIRETRHASRAML